LLQSLFQKIMATKALALGLPTKNYFSLDFTKKNASYSNQKKVSYIQPCFKRHLFLKIIWPALLSDHALA